MKGFKFTFEELTVWHKSVDFAGNIIDTTENIAVSRNHFRLFDQINCAATSIALNIAEGKGRFSKKEFIQFLYIARGSLYETITLLRIFNKKNWINNAKLVYLEDQAVEISKMLSALIKSIRISL